MFLLSGLKADMVAIAALSWPLHVVLGGLMIRLVCLSALSRYARLCVVDARPTFAERA